MSVALRQAPAAEASPSTGDAGIPGVTRGADGRPRIPLQAGALFAFAWFIRRAELLLLDLFSKGQLSGTTHTCYGQEFCQMAVVRALDHADDAVLSNHRNHGHFLTYSGDFLGLVAEIMGRAAGVCGGRGGSQHMAWRHFHSNGVQAGMTGIGVGLARARADAGSDGIVAAMVGDGTLGEGLLYESLNLASVWSAPVLFVVECNGIAQTTDTRSTVAGDIVARGRAFGLECWRVGDHEPHLWRTAEEAVAYVRAHRRPGFLVIDTGRLGPHSKGDDLRTGSEMAALQARDPVERLGASLDPRVRASIETAADAFFATLTEAAYAAPESRFASVPQSLFDGARLPDDPAGHTTAPGKTVRAALNAALERLLVEDPRTIVLGEDLHDPYGGAFKVTAGLTTRFPTRVISTPISEAALTGSAIGLALAGRRPVAEIMFGDFVTLCADQLYNHAVKFAGIFPDLAVPLVMRTPPGGRRGYGPTHSQSPEALLGAIPGLTIIYGSHRHDMGRLLWNAVQHWPFPTLFLEHKLLYGLAQERADYTELPAHPADAAGALFPTLRRGPAPADAAIVAYGGMVPLAEEAAARLQHDEELEVAILVPAQLAPLPRHALAAALSPYPVVVVAEEAPAAGGIGAELLASLAEAGFRGRLRRVAPPPVPIPAARSLETAILPDAGAIARAVLDALNAA
jgi:2-oxoisovalerate dehydrogenase E1 component